MKPIPPAEGLLVALLAVAVLFPLAAMLPAQAARTARQKAPEADRFLQGAPFQLSDILRMLEGIGAGAFLESRMVEGIRARGVDFVFTPEIQEVLKAQNASIEVLAEIRAKAKAPPPPVEKKPQTGALAVSCVPAECNVQVNSGAVRATTDGDLLLDDLPIGKAKVMVTRDGYESFSQDVEITAGRLPVRVQLKPSMETRARFGSAMFESMLAALGSDRTLKGYAEIAAAGAATTTDADGAATEWTIDFRFNPPDLVQMQAANPSGSLTLTCRGEQCTTKTGGGRFPFGGKKLKADESARLVSNLHLFRRYQIREFLRRLAAESTQFSAPDSPSAGGQRQLLASASHERYEINMGADGLPQLVVFHSETSPASGSRYLFAEYTSVAGTRYPKRTEIRLADSRQGIEVRFGTIDSVTHGATGSAR